MQRSCPDGFGTPHLCGSPSAANHALREHRSMEKDGFDSFPFAFGPGAGAIPLTESTGTSEPSRSNVETPDVGFSNRVWTTALAAAGDVRPPGAVSGACCPKRNERRTTQWTRGSGARIRGLLEVWTLPRPGRRTPPIGQRALILPANYWNYR